MTNVAWDRWYNVLKPLGACLSTDTLAFNDILPMSAKPNWTRSDPTPGKWAEMVDIGGRKIAGPMLVLHGNKDPVLCVDATRKWVDKTMEMYKEARIEYVELDGVSHNGACTAAQWVWTDWIAQRFGGVAEASRGTRTIKPPRPVDAYQKEINWWIAEATQFYHAP